MVTHFLIITKNLMDMVAILTVTLLVVTIIVYIMQNMLVTITIGPLVLPTTTTPTLTPTHQMMEGILILRHGTTLGHIIQTQPHQPPIHH